MNLRQIKHDKVKTHPFIHMMALETASLVVGFFFFPPFPIKEYSEFIFLTQKGKGYSVFYSPAEAEKVSKQKIIANWELGFQKLSCGGSIDI